MHVHIDKEANAFLKEKKIKSNISYYGAWKFLKCLLSFWDVFFSKYYWMTMLKMHLSYWASYVSAESHWF